MKNPLAVVCISLATTTALVPFATGFYLGGALGGLVGLWTSCLLLGFVATGAAKMAVTIVESGLSFGTEYFVVGVRKGITMGPVVGIGTFVVTFVLSLFVALPLRGIAWWCVLLIGLYLLAAWYVVAMVALVCWASADAPGDIRGAFATAVDLLFHRPAMGVWVLVQSVGWFLLSIPLILLPFVVTPGHVTLIDAALVVATREDLAAETTTADAAVRSQPDSR